MKHNKYPQQSGHDYSAETAPAPTDREPLETIKVRAIAVGYIANVYRNIGDVFLIQPIQTPILEDRDGEMKPVLEEDGITPKMRVIPARQQFSHKWMEEVGEEVPERVTGAGDILKIETHALNGGHGDSGVD